MATCKDCIHHDICDAKGNLILTINDICELEYRTDVSEWWCKHFKLTADVVPKSEVEELIKSVDDMLDLVCAMTGLELTYYGKYAELKKKYTEGEMNYEISKQ